jgi:Uri superfamily endonuclease
MIAWFQKSEQGKAGFGFFRMRTGAYLLYLDLQQCLTIKAGRLKQSLLPAGKYVYVGSATRGMEQRIARHRRLAEQKCGKLHWHIDFLLIHPEVRLIGEKKLAGSRECAVSQRIAAQRGTTIPVPRFGSTDCRAGCKAHLYKITDRVDFQRLSQNSTGECE